MKKFHLIILLAAVFLLASCHDFLHKYPKDLTYATSCADYNELLVGEGYMDVMSGQDIGEWIHLMDDDVSFMIKDQGNRLGSCAFYWWEPTPDTESTWNVLYKRIGIMNVILDGVDEFSEEGEVYRKVKGEALFLRGAYYYFLVNLYAKPYQEASATSDLGVPLKLDAQVEDRRVSRNSLQTCYNQIVSDLENAVSYLKGVKQTTNYRANEIAARCLLSRVLLYMGKWEKVVHQCDTIMMDKSYNLLDFNTLTAKDGGISGTSSETFFTNGKNVYYSGGGSYLYYPNLSAYYTCNEEFLNSYDARDLRLTCFFNSTMIYPPFPPKTYGGIPDKNRSGDCSDFFLLRLPEAYLNKAEALAMLERADDAKRTVHELRLKRFKTGSIDDEELNYTMEDLVNFIRNERRFEFTFEGHRWFDLRRYAVSPKWAFQTEISHFYYTDSERDGNIVLGKYADEPEYYVLPIPENEIVLNEGVLKQNPTRAEKTPVR